MLNTTAKRLATGLVLSGLIYAAPVVGQSALAQQSTSQQSSKSSATNGSTAKSTAPKSTASKSTASQSTTTAKKTPPKPLVYVEDDRSVKSADASKTSDSSASKNAGTSTGKTVNASAKKPVDTSSSQKPLSGDLTKAFAQNCPSVALTESKSKAAYDVMLERDPTSKGVKSAFGLHKGSRIEVMNKSGKELFSENGHSTSQLVKDACTAIGTPSVKVAQN